MRWQKTPITSSETLTYIPVPRIPEAKHCTARLLVHPLSHAKQHHLAYRKAFIPRLQRPTRVGVKYVARSCREPEPEAYGDSCLCLEDPYALVHAAPMCEISQDLGRPRIETDTPAASGRSSLCGSVADLARGFLAKWNASRMMFE